MTPLRRTLVVAAVVLGALCAGPAAAVAHPLLLQTAPTAGLVAPGSPGAIRLQFSEPVVARGSRVRLTGPRGERVATGAVVLTEDKKGFSVAPSRALPTAVYRVAWTALGDDGHLVRGDFDFGVPGKAGAPPPGAERLGGPGASGLGGERTDQDGFVGTIARWLGIAAASFLLGGAALLGRLRRRPDAAAVADAAAARLRPLAPLAWLLAAVAASESVIARVVDTADGSTDLGLLTSGATGEAELARAVVLVAGSVVLLLVSGRVRPARRDLVFGTAGAAVLLTYALSGHALAGVGAVGLVAQAVHVLAAGLWLGGVLALVALAREGEEGDAPVRATDGARAFAPLAAGGLGLAIVTGVIAAAREVDRWFLLRWSDYGRVVLVKSALVGLVALAGGWAAWRSRRPDGPGPARAALRLEAGGVLAVLALAAVLAGLAQGRGRPLPAEAGTLFPGPAFATALLDTGTAKVTLTPGRRGPSELIVTPADGVPAPQRASVRLACACAPGRDLRAPLRRTADRTWTADVDLPADGQWFAYLTTERGRAATPVSLTTGVPHTAGSAPADLLVVADLSGAGAARCRAHLVGLQLAVGRINADGGVDGGRKLQPLVLDDRGSAARSATIAAAAIRSGRPVALAGACGDGASAAVRAAVRAGVPVIAADPGLAPTSASGVFNLAADPAAQGYGLVQDVALHVVPLGAPGVRRIAVLAGRDAAGAAFLSGVRRQAATAGLTVEPLAPGALAGRSAAALKRFLDRRRIAALLLDGPRAGGEDAAALVRLGRTRYDFPPAPIFLSERVLSESFVMRTGTLGRIGVIQGASEVSTQTADALAYSRAVRTLFVGESPSLDGLRGYVGGLALRAAIGGDRSLGAAAIRKRLVSPPVFSDALLTPWSPGAPGRGSQAIIALAPQFLAAGIVPVQQGGERFDGTYFPDGAWINASISAFGPGAPTPKP